ncbi:MAG: hypothetical protein OEW19_10640, partial [Acidobacteriota bacterium]|nr:hypothetical protein [Acidobacteriota bacterium]
MTIMKTGVGHRKSGLGGVALMALVAALAGGPGLSAQGKPAAPSPSGGNGKMYIGTYAGDIQIFDEATETLEGRIEL